MSYQNGVAKFSAHKGGETITVEWVGSPNWKVPKPGAPIASDRVVGVDTESLTLYGQLETLLIPISFEKGSELIETPSGKGMLEAFCERIFYEYSASYSRDSFVKQRPRRERNTPESCSRDGRRETVTPVLSVWYNLEYDFGRLAGEIREVQRSVKWGADSYRVKVGRFEVEIARMVMGAAPNFEWFIYDRSIKEVVRVFGIDMFGYWKKGLDSAASSLGVGGKQDIKEVLGEDVFTKPREMFTREEWEIFKKYALNDAGITRLVYLQTVEMLTKVDFRVVRQSGVIPFSAPGAAARISFAHAADCHPGLEKWARYDSVYDQMGLDAYRAGRAFCHLPGVYQNMISLDVVSMYPYTSALLPDPVTVQMEHVEEVEGFDLERFVGKFGVLYIDGESLDDLNPPFRVHGKQKLHYVFGEFKDQPVTIPEVVIGVMRGALRVDRIKSGCIMHGTADKSFIRASLSKYFKIKADADAEIERLEAESTPEDVIKPFRVLRELGKLLANSFYGKLVQINTGTTNGPLMWVPVFMKKKIIARSMVRIMVEFPDELDEKYYTGETAEQRESVKSSFRANPSRQKGEEGAIAAYVEALCDGGVTRTEAIVKLSTFLKKHARQGRAGGNFMPLYAAQITGLASAMLACMSSCVDAIQGDTDSVHFVLPKGFKPTDISRIPGYGHYYDVMARAGYPTPRFVDGELVDGVPGMLDAGTWKVEQKEGSEESVLITLKRYSHKFRGGVFKQAQHTFSKFWDPIFDTAESAKELKTLKGAKLHEHMRSLLEGKSVTYMGKRSPRKFRDAIKRSLTVGEFTSESRTVDPPESDENTYRDEFGYVRWKCFNWNEKEEIPVAAE